MTPEIEIREIVTSALAAHMPEREIRNLIDQLCLLVARSLDTALFDASQQPGISAQMEWLYEQWEKSSREFSTAIEIWKDQANKWKALAHKWRELHEKTAGQLRGRAA